MVIRRALARDSHGIALVHVLSWQHAYRGIVPQAHLDQLSVLLRTRGLFASMSGSWPIVLRPGPAGDELLGFRHPHAGVQLVKGTIEDGENPASAALRELAEEPGIRDARVVRSLGAWKSGYEP